MSQVFDFYEISILKFTKKVSIPATFYRTCGLNKVNCSIKVSTWLKLIEPLAILIRDPAPPLPRPWSNSNTPLLTVTCVVSEVNGRVTNVCPITALNLKM